MNYAFKPNFQFLFIFSSFEYYNDYQTFTVNYYFNKFI